MTGCSARTEPGRSGLGAEFAAFNVLYWLGFWASPMLVQLLEQWPQVSWLQCWLWLKQGIVFTAAMAALAEVCGRFRRFFYLAAGLLMWGGAVIATVFLATTGITANAFTALTGMVYSAHDDAGLRYLVFSERDFVGVLTATCPFLLLLVRWRSVGWPASLTAFSLAGSVCVVITACHWIWHDYGPGHPTGASRLDTIGTVLDPAPPIAAYVSIVRALPLAREMMLRPDRPPPRIRSSASQRPFTLLVVVGESTTRNHMALYGYCRNTTPILDGMSSDLFVFRNTVSEIPMTVFALSNSFRVALDRARGRPDQSVFDVFNAAGFTTYWLSNQFDYPGDPVSQLTQRAQHQTVTYRGKKNAAEYTSTLDVDLLGPLDAVLSGDSASKIVFLHTVGTHSSYDDRVPVGYLANAFRDDSLNRDASQRKTIDAYDKAVRYADFFLSEVINRAARQAGATAVVYFSDHGDEVFDNINFVGHRYPRSTHGMVEIPLLVWLSPQLRAARPALVSALGEALTEKFDTRDISPLLLDIADIRVEGLPDQRRPLGGSFVAQQRLVAGADYDRDATLGIPGQLPALVCQRNSG